MFMRQIFTGIFLIYLLLMSHGCSDSATTEEEQPQTEVSMSLSGTVTDPAGAPLAGVHVKSGSRSTLTDDNGAYTLTLPEAQEVSVTANLEYYTESSRVAHIVSGEQSVLDLTMLNVDTIELFNAADGATIQTKGASVTLPDAYVYPDGTPYIGEITATVSYNRVTTVQGAMVFPGDYLGLQTDGTTSVLQSYGFIDVTLKDAQGDPIQLAAGKKATLVYPMDSHIEATPESIPLWYYDTERGIWVEEGLATYDALSNSYSGDVTHFTTWNLDRKFDGAEYNGCVEDANGVPLPYVDLFISATAWSKHLTNRDPEGKFRLINAPSNMPISIYAKLGQTVSLQETVILLPGEVREADTCLVLDKNITDLFTTVIGQVVDSDGLPIQGATVMIDNTTVATDINGTFSIPIIRSSDNTLMEISFSVEPNLYMTKSFPLDNASVTDVGTIQLRATHLLGCLLDTNGLPYTYTGEGGGNIFLDEPYGLFDIDSEIATDNTGMFDLYLPFDFQQHTLYGFDNFKERASTSLEFTANISLLDLRQQCMQLQPIVDRNITTTLTIVDHNGTAATMEIMHNTYDVNIGRNGYPYFFGTTIATDVNTTTLSTLKDGNYLVKLALPSNEVSDFTGITVRVVVGQQLDELMIVPLNKSTLVQGADWFFFKIEVFQGVAKLIPVNLLGTPPS